MDLLSERYNLPKLTQEEIDNMNKSISIKEMELITNNPPKEKAPTKWVCW